jgi:hypothetical protein
LEYLDWRSFQWLDSLYWRPSRVIWNIYTGGRPVGIFILESFQSHLESLYWRASSSNGIFILEVIQCNLGYLYWRSSSATWNVYTGGHPVPIGIFILEILPVRFGIFVLEDHPVGIFILEGFQFVHTG